MEQFIVGTSEATEAEYGCRSDHPVTLITMVEGEVDVVEGFATIEAAKADLTANSVPASQIEYL